MISTDHIAILIPAFNPSQKMLILIEKLRQLDNNILILIINDGSEKQFAYHFDHAAKQHQAHVISHAINIGKGAALKTGINFLLINYPEIRTIVTADADGQHAPFDILKLVEESNKIPDHLVLGYRTFEKEVPFRSRLGNNISKIVYRCLLGLNFKDTQTGLRAIPRALAIETLKIKANKYELETEQLIIAARNKIPISQVPIKTIYEEGNASSHFNPIFDSIRIYYSLFRYFIASIITAITDFVAYLIISRFADIVLSNLLSRYVALFVQYTLIKKFVFKSEGSISKLIIFIGIVSLTGLISGVLQKELIGSTGMSLVVSKIIVDSGLFIFNFLFLRDILFGKEDID